MKKILHKDLQEALDIESSETTKVDMDFILSPEIRQAAGRDTPHQLNVIKYLKTKGNKL